MFQDFPKIPRQSNIFSLMSYRKFQQVSSTKKKQKTHYHSSPALLSDQHIHKLLTTYLLTDADKLAHCVRTVPECYLIWLFWNQRRGKQLAGGPKHRIRFFFFFLSGHQDFPFLSFKKRWGGILFSSTKNKRSTKSGRNIGVPVCLRAAGGCSVLASRCQLRSPPPDNSLVPFVSLRPCYAYTSSTACSNTSPSVCLCRCFLSLPEQRSTLCVEVQRACDALPSIVSGTDTFTPLSLLLQVAWVCWLEGSVNSGQVVHLI